MHELVSRLGTGLRQTRARVSLLVLALVLGTFEARPDNGPISPTHLVSETTPMVDVVVQSTRDVGRGLAGRGGRVRTVIPTGLSRAGRHLSGTGFLATARVPQAVLPEIAAWPGVVAVVVGERLVPQLDQSVSAAHVGATDVWAVATDHIGRSVTGKGVLVGIADTGVDWSHGDFRLNGGATRIAALWDQSAGAGALPSGLPSVAYGRAFSSAHIDVWNASATVPGTPCGSAACVASGAAGVNTPDDRSAGGSSSSDAPAGHGTHVLGAAVSGGRALSCETVGCSPVPYRGVAPDADIVVVRTDLQTTHVIDAWTWMRDLARMRGQPLVILNALSVARAGAHDGTHPLEVAIDAISGPGTIIVTASGNNGALDAHASGIASTGTLSNAKFAVYSGDSPTVDANIDLWTRAADLLEFRLDDPYGQQVFPFTATGAGAMVATTSDGTSVSFNPSAEAPATTNGAHATISLHRSRGLQGAWTLSVHALSVGENDGKATPGRWDAWIDPDTKGTVRWLDTASSGTTNGIDLTGTLSEPGTARQAIVVGSYVSRGSWVDVTGTSRQPAPTPVMGAVSTFSGRGPARDGLARPDIAAPGEVIVAARSQTATIADSNLVGSAARHRAASGTSVAAAHAAGVVALLMQVKSDLTPDLVRTLLREGASAPPGGAWDGAWGTGRLRAAPAVQAALALPLSVTPTATSAATPTSSATATSTPLPTATATSTPPPTATATSNFGATASATPTAAASVTATASPSPTASATATPTSILTQSPTGSTSTPVTGQTTPTTSTPTATSVSSATRTPTTGASPTRSATASRTATATRTATPTPVTEMVISLLLTRAVSVPAPAYAVPVRVSLYRGPSVPGSRTPVVELDLVSDQTGMIDVIVPGLDGVYDLVVKPSGALSHEVSAVSLRPNAIRAVSLDKDRFRDGDADGNDRIDAVDLARLRAAYGRTSSDPLFDPAVDFDRDGEVTVLDFSAVVRNLGYAGPIPVN
ncbi:MAG: hypothetical protein EB058_00530 [Proteobacteria bacterium]|nr:hypothetical protein [Pseudomonadota bacterium]NDG98014.1 hypothetical protein [Pseudomonadota bacterium]